MDLGYLQAALEENDRKKNEIVEFEYSVFSNYKLRTWTGEVELVNSGRRSHFDFKPKWRHKMRLIFLILRF